MASHEQVHRNIADTNGAWGRLQWLTAQKMPQRSAHITNWAGTVGTKGSIWP